jgi:hypothetical protein
MSSWEATLSLTLMSRVRNLMRVMAATGVQRVQRARERERRARLMGMVSLEPRKAMGVLQANLARNFRKGGRRLTSA